jgi:hypothetical protein
MILPVILGLVILVSQCAVWLSASPVRAEDTYGSFDPYTGNYSYFEERGFTRPRQEESYGQRRQRESSSRQEHDRQERSYSQPDASTTSKVPAYKDNYTVITPNGQIFCQRSFGNTVYCQ